MWLVGLCHNVLFTQLLCWDYFMINILNRRLTCTYKRKLVFTTRLLCSYPTVSSTFLAKWLTFWQHYSLLYWKHSPNVKVMFVGCSPSVKCRVLELPYKYSVVVIYCINNSNILMIWLIVLGQKSEVTGCYSVRPFQRSKVDAWCCWSFSIDHSDSWSGQN